MLGAIRLLLVMAYPVLVYLSLQHYEPRQVAPMLLLFMGGLLLLRTKRDKTKPSLMYWAGPLLLLALVPLVAFSNSEYLLRFYPALMNIAMLAIFMHSLVCPPTIVERIARLKEPDLSPRVVAYTRKVTLVWCGFFLINGSIAAYTALFASRETWAWYNGGVAYVLMGLLFAGEWLIRQQVRRAGP